MTWLVNGFGPLGAPGMAGMLLVLSLAALECERWWTRARRRKAAQPGAFAYALDGLMVVAALLGVVVLVLLVIRAIAGLFALAGAGATWAGAQASAQPLALAGIVAVCVAATVGVVLLRWRATARRDGSAARMGGAQAGVHEREDPDAAAPVESLSTLSMHQSRPKPAAVTHPASFLTLATPEAPAVDTKRGKGNLATALVALLVIGLVGGAIVFRQQALDLLAGGAQARVEPTALPRVAPTTGAASTASAAPSGAVAPAAATRRVKGDSLNLRIAPGTDQRVAQVLVKGDTVELLNESAVVQNVIWVKVRVGDREGWVSQKLLE
jgi:hypothetical protein